MIEEKHGFYYVTDEGKKEFALHSTASRSNSVMILIGIAIIALTLGLELKLVPILSVTFFGIALIIVGSMFLTVDRRNRAAIAARSQSFTQRIKSPLKSATFVRRVRFTFTFKFHATAASNL